MDGIAGPYVDRQSEVLHRLLAGYHTKLKDGNKEKLATVGGLLLDRLMDLASTPPTTLPSAEAARDRVPAIPAALMEPLCPAIYTIAEQLPVQVALCIRERLEVVMEEWREERSVAALKAKGKGGGKKRRRVEEVEDDDDDDDEEEEQGEGGPFVSLPPSGLALIALCVQIYPLSDYRHDILTPLIVFVSEVLSQSTYPSSQVDLRRLLFLCSCALHLVGAAGRWMPELYPTAKRLLSHLMAHPPGQQQDAEPPKKKAKKAAAPPPTPPPQAAASPASPTFTAMRMRAATSSCKSIRPR